jgi:hypothetical protein
MVDDGVAPCSDGPSRAPLADATGLGLVDLAGQLVVELLGFVGDLGDEGPLTLVAEGIREPLAADHDAPAAVGVIRFQDEEEALDVAEVVDLGGVHARPVEEEHVAALEDAAHGAHPSRPAATGCQASSADRSQRPSSAAAS